MNSDLRIDAGNERFERCYDLLQATFHANELSEKAVFLSDFQLRLPDGIAPYVMLARFDTLSPDLPISLICGCYLVIDPRQQQSIGFIEYLTTRAGFRYQKGHGTTMLTAFEGEMRRIAAARGDHLLLVVGEAAPDILDFKFRRGYRWPADSAYLQPPIAFDPLTGDPLYAPVPLTLMIKLMAESAPASISRDVLIQSVRTIYDQRYGLRDVPSSAQSHERVKAEIDTLLARFIASLPPDKHEIDLVSPV